MIKKISFVVCLLFVLDVYACKYILPCLNKHIMLKTCSGILDDMACARLDPKFKDFENFFDVEKVRAEMILTGSCEDIGKNFTFYVTPKVKIPLESIFFRFDMAFADSSFKISPLWSFKKSPLDAVESFKKMAAAIHKNPSFEKWLEKNAKERAERKKFFGVEKFAWKNNQEEYIRYENIAVIRNQKDIHVGGKFWYDSDEPIEIVWDKIVKSGKYVGELAFCGAPDFCSRVEYCGSPYFLLGDNGDVFVPEIRMSLWNSKKENILDVSWDEIGHFADARLKQCKVQKSSKGILSYIEDFLCNHSLASEKRCAEWRSKYYKTEYCDYLIIRNDGTIEYGPKSGNKRR